MLLTRLLRLPENQAKLNTRLSTALAGLRMQFDFHLDAPPVKALPLPGERDLSGRERSVLADLRRDVEAISTPIGRNVFHPEELARCEAYLAARLGAHGPVKKRPASVSMGVQTSNYELEMRGASRPGEIVVIGAHYDSVEIEDRVRAEHGNCPGANDNASGVAMTIALARLARERADAGEAPARTLRFVLFANEEPPFFWTEEMGSRIYADECARRGENIVAMLTPETVGYYSDEPGSQRLPLNIGRDAIGDVGNSLALIGLSGSKDLLLRCSGAFRAASTLRCIGAEVPAIVPMAGASDHWSFWRHGYPALMVTDTAPFRYDFYHQWRDTPDKLTWPAFARATAGMDAVVRTLAAGG
ncbi:MAG TPA: M28 family peptidase [Phycisphaerales bacterium]|nr:M28 family peptidase [Phycisphaerales bacterium]